MSCFRSAWPFRSNQSQAAAAGGADDAGMIKRTRNPKKKADGFYNLVLIGKTGFGKSTTARKLLEWDKYESRIKTINLDNGTATEAIKPESGNGFFHVTREFQAWENPDTKVRVLDVPGFADTERSIVLDVRKKNLAIVHRIASLADRLNFTRILYFLPTRGVPERADGFLREELQLLFNFFGDLIFKLMIVVCTNHPDSKYQTQAFDCKLDGEAVKKVINYALRGKAKDDHSEIEVVYFPVDAASESIIKTVKDTYHKETDTVLTMDENACMKCLGNDCDITQACKLHHKPYQCVDMCHPEFVPKKKRECPIAIDDQSDVNAHMSKDEKLIYRFYWNFECTICRSPPGSHGCTKLNENGVCHNPIIDRLLDDMSKDAATEMTHERKDNISLEQSRTESSNGQESGV